MTGVKESIQNTTHIDEDTKNYLARNIGTFQDKKVGLHLSVASSHFQYLLQHPITSYHGPEFVNVSPASVAGTTEYFKTVSLEEYIDDVVNSMIVDARVA